MSTTLAGAKGVLHVNNWWYRSKLELAHAYGWQPAGTVAPELGDGNASTGWEPMEYFSHDWQRVTDADAAGIAEALDRFLVDFPEKLKGLEAFKGLVDGIAEFASFCRASGFTVG